MFIAILTLLSALSISAVAIYYSIAGLAAIFAGAVIPIMIMGTVLEVGKLITASWLYQYWKLAPRFLKYYLSVAVLVLMFITSMGIFGYLSKAHIEQTSLSQEQVALIDTLDDKIDRSTLKIDRWTGDIDRLMKGEDVRVDNLISAEQQVLNDLYAKIKQEKDDIRVDFDKQIELQNNRLTQAKERKDADIAAAQERYKGAFSKKGLDDAIALATSNELAVASAAQTEIKLINSKLDEALSSIDTKYAEQIRTIESRIQSLRDQANAKTEDIDGRILELEGFIDQEQLIVDQAREEKFIYEKEYRKLEAEVGPIKYIAEFIYGQEADRDLLEEAVRWVIIVIIFVFDPLAVLLLIAANFTFKHRYGRSFEEMIGVPGPDGSPGGVTPDSYWKERYEDMQSQLDEFNKLKEQQDTQKAQEDVRAEKIQANLGIDLPSASYQLDMDYSITEEQKEDFKKREEAEKKKLEEIAQKAREEIIEEVYPMPDVSTDVESRKEPEVTIDDMHETDPPKTIVEEVEVKDLSDEDLKKKT